MNTNIINSIIENPQGTIEIFIATPLAVMALAYYIAWRVIKPKLYATNQEIPKYWHAIGFSFTVLLSASIRILVMVLMIEKTYDNGDMRIFWVYGFIVPAIIASVYLSWMSKMVTKSV